MYSACFNHPIRGHGHRPMKILHAISSVNPAGGGPVEGIRQLGSTLEHDGHHVEIVSLDPPTHPF